MQFGAHDLVKRGGVAALDDEEIVDWQHDDTAFYKLQHHALGKIGVVALQPQPGFGTEVGGDPDMFGHKDIQKVARLSMSTLAADLQGQCPDGGKLGFSIDGNIEATLCQPANDTVDCIGVILILESDADLRVEQLWMQLPIVTLIDSLAIDQEHRSDALGQALPERPIEPTTKTEGAIVEDTIKLIPGEIDDYLSVRGDN